MTKAENPPGRLKTTLIASAFVVVVATVVTCSIVTWLAIRSQKADTKIQDVPLSSFIPITSISKRQGPLVHKRTLDLDDDSEEAEPEKNGYNRKPKEDRPKGFENKSQIFRDSYEIFMEMQKKLGFTTVGEVSAEIEKKIVKKEVDLKPVAITDHRFFLNPEDAFFLDPSSERPNYDLSVPSTKSVPRKSNEIDFASPVWNFKQSLEMESVEDASEEGEVGLSDSIRETINLEIPDIMKNFVPLSVKPRSQNSTEKDKEVHLKTAKNIYEEFSRKRKNPKTVNDEKEKFVKDVLDTSETTRKILNQDFNNSSEIRTKSELKEDDFSEMSQGGEDINIKPKSQAGVLTKTTTTHTPAVVMNTVGTKVKTKKHATTKSTDDDDERQKSSDDERRQSTRKPRPRSTTKSYTSTTTSKVSTTFGTKHKLENLDFRPTENPKSYDLDDDGRQSFDYDEFSEERVNKKKSVERTTVRTTTVSVRKKGSSIRNEEADLDEDSGELPLYGAFPPPKRGELQSSINRHRTQPSNDAVRLDDRFSEQQESPPERKRKRPPASDPSFKNEPTSMGTRRTDYEQLLQETTHHDIPHKRPKKGETFPKDEARARPERRKESGPPPKGNLPPTYVSGEVSIENTEDQYDDVVFRRQSPLPYQKMDRMGIMSFTANDAVEVQMNTGYQFESKKTPHVQAVEQRNVLPRMPVSTDYLTALHNSENQPDSWVPGTLINKEIPSHLQQDTSAKHDKTREVSSTSKTLGEDSTSSNVGLGDRTPDGVYSQSIRLSHQPPSEGLERKNTTVLEIMTAQGDVYNYVAKVSEKHIKAHDEALGSSRRKNSKLSTDTLPI